MRTISLAVIIFVVMFSGISVEAATYKVAKGDTPSKVAKKLGISTKQVMQLAGITDARKLRIGKVIDTDKLASAKSPAKVESSKIAAISKENVASKEISAQEPVVVKVKLESDTQSDNQAKTEVTTENLKVAESKSMTVSRNPTFIPETGREGQSKQAGPNKFVEASLTLGGWGSPSSKTDGIYLAGEGTGWVGNLAGDKNYGLGLYAQFDKGWGRDSIEWGSKILALQPAYWQNFKEDYFVLLKPRIGYRWNDDHPTDKPENSFTAGGYFELSKVIDARDLGIIAADGWYFPNDSYGALRVWWERVLDPMWKVKGGIGPVAHWQKDATSLGISPALAVKYNDTVTVGTTIDTSRGGVFYGGFITVEYNSDIHDPLSYFGRRK